MKPVFGVTPPPERRVDYVIADIVTTPDFDGETYDRERDHDRLAVQLGAVRRHMQDHEWHTLREISKCEGYPEASVSARLRDLRKPEHGSHVIERRYVRRGLHEYRMAP